MSDPRVNNCGQWVDQSGDKYGNAGQSAGVGVWKTATIAKAGTTSNTVDLEGNFAYVQVVIPTIDAATLKLQVGAEGQKFQDLGQSVTTVSGTGAFNDTWVLAGWQFIKIVASAAQNTADVPIRVRGVTY